MNAGPIGIALVVTLIALAAVVLFRMDEPWFEIIPVGTFFLSLGWAVWRSSQGPPPL